MKLTNTIAALILTLTGSLAHADNGVDSTQLYLALSEAGVSSEVSLGKVYVGVSDLFCYRENTYSEYTCEMTDTGIEAEGQKIRVSGKLAENILTSFSGEAPFDPYAKFEFAVSGVTCQTRNGPIDIQE